MPIPTTFTEATDWFAVDAAIHGFGDSLTVTEEDLIAALQAVKLWQMRFTEPFTREYRGEEITWLRFESLIWDLGEAFRRIMLRTRVLRRRKSVFEAVRAVCLDQRFGKGRESFTMLLGQYGDSAQIPTLIGLLDDQQISGHAVYALRLLGASEAADRVRPLLHSPRAWVKKEAIKYFRKVESVTQV